LDNLELEDSFCLILLLTFVLTNCKLAFWESNKFGVNLKDTARCILKARRSILFDKLHASTPKQIFFGEKMKV